MMNRAECRVGEACDSQYQVGFDIRDSLVLRSYMGAPDYQERRQRFVSYLERQLRADVGERMKEDESPPVIYQIRDGKLYSLGSNQPFELTMWKGIGRKPIDRPRDIAEIEGFFNVIQGLADPKTPDKSMVVAPSPRGLPGSDYTENCFEIAIRDGDLVILRRFNSNLTNEEYRDKLIEMNPYAQFLIPENPTDVDFKRNPITVPSELGFRTIEEVRKFFMKEKIGTPTEEVDRAFEKVKTILVVSYTNTIIENPEALIEARVIYKAIQKGVVMASESDIVSFEGMTRQQVAELADSNVKVGAGACGSCSSGGLESDEFGPLSFNCPSCGVENIRPRGQLIELCKNKECRRRDGVLPPGLRKLLPRALPN